MTMTEHFRPLLAALVLSFALLPSACAGRMGSGQGASQIPRMGGSVAPAAVSDEDFANATHKLLVKGTPSSSRLSLLAGAVQRQFIRAASYFDAGQDDRGLDALAGALYLVRAGELHREMLDGRAVAALRRARAIVAQQGDEGRTLAFLHLESAGLAEKSQEQAAIRRHLAALDAWFRDTRRRSDVENGAADHRAYAERAVLEPSKEAIEQARAATERWILAAVRFNAKFRPGVDRPDRDEMIDAYRGLRTGAIVMAALYLRHGDASSALKALEQSEAKRAVPSEFLDRIRAAAVESDAGAWRELAGLYAGATTQASGQDVFLAPEVARGAAWGAALEAYRLDPGLIENAAPLAQMLPGLGMPDVSPLVLLDGVRAAKNASVVADSLVVLMQLLAQQDEAHDLASAKRVFVAAQPLLSLADGFAGTTPLNPSPSRVRLAMAQIHMRSGDVVAARPLLESSNSKDPSAVGYLSLAAVMHQASQDMQALDAVGKSISAPDAEAQPLVVADAHLLAFSIHREQGKTDLARASLAAALRATMAARARASTPPARLHVERVLARIAYHFGDAAAWTRAIARAFEHAGADRSATGAVLIEAASGALLRRDIEASKRALRLAQNSDVLDEDLVYAALWLSLAEGAKVARMDQTLVQAFASIKKGSSWVSSLARWGEGSLDDKALVSRARTLVQQTEAAFYTSARRFLAGDAGARAELTRIARGPALDLVETHLARELTLPNSAKAFGPPPAPLP